MKNTLKIIGGRILSILFAIFLTACGSGGGGGGGSDGSDGGNGNGGVETGTISGSVSGTTVIAVNDSGDIVAIDDTTGKTPDANSNYPFTLSGIPTGTNIRIYLVTGGNIYPMYFDSNGDNIPDANVFSLSSATDIALGFVDLSGTAAPANNPLDISGVTSGGENTTVPPKISDTYKAIDYYPLDIDNRWVYNLGIVTVLDETHTFSGGIGWRIENASLVCVSDDIFAAHSVGDGLVAYGAYDRDNDAYSEFLTLGKFVFLPEEMRVGDSWVIASNTGWTITYHFIGWETVTVPAGTFPDSLKVRADVVDPGGTYTTIFWYAKNVGQIKVERTAESPAGFSGCMIVTSGNPLVELQSALIKGVSYP